MEDAAMSRANYTDESDDQWAQVMWRGAVASAIKGKRGQAFLREMLVALDSLPEKKLISGKLQDETDDTAVCSLGAVGRLRGVDLKGFNPEGDEDDCCYELDTEGLAGVLKISDALTREIMYMNDDAYSINNAEERWMRMRAWVERQIIK
jgi:hypothetical protein